MTGGFVVKESSLFLAEMEASNTSNASTSAISASVTSGGITYNRPVSALEDSANYNIRHPLQSKWTLWYRASTKPTSTAVKNAAKSDNWEASLQCVNTVDTIEDFWGMYNNVPGIDKMEDNSDYMFFKEGIRPAWEDPANADGGSFTLQFKGSTQGIGEFVWLNTLMMAVGSTLTHYEKVTGIFFAKRSNRTDRISLWLSSSDREICRQSETEWIELLQKVNTENFNMGMTTFTNHKGSGHRAETRAESHGHGRDNRDRDNRDRDSRDNRDRDSRDNRDNRDSRDNRDRRSSGPPLNNRFSSGGAPRSSGSFPNRPAEGRSFETRATPTENRTNEWSRQSSN